MKKYHPKMLWMFSIAVAAAIVIFVVIDLLFSKMIGEMVLVKNIEYVDKISEKLVNEAEYMSEKASSVFNFLQYNNLPQEYFKSENTSHYFDVSREMYSFLISVNVIYPELDDIVLIGKRVLCSKMRYRDIYHLIDEAEVNGTSCRGIMLQEGINGERYKVVTFLSKIYGNETGKEEYARPIGKSIVSIRLGNLKWLEIDNKGNTSFLLLDDDMNYYPINCSDEKAFEIISYINKNDIDNEIDNKRFLLKTQEVGKSTLKIVSYTDKAELLSDTSYVQGLILALGAVSVILLMIITAAVYYYVILPIFALKNHMLTVAHGDYTKINRNIEVEGSKEIVQLARAFNAMTDEIHDRTLRLFNTTNSLYEMEMEMEKQKAEIAFLRSQINPHFLYNSLEAIKGLCMRNGLTEAANVTNCLGKIFRYSIKGGTVVKLKDELDITKAYIEIQKSRFPQKVEVIYNFSDETLNVPIIPMLLQPIIENVFEHSVEKNTESTILYLASWIKNDELFLTVQDNGIGIAPEKLDELRSILGSEIAYNSGGVGIANVDLRLRMTYGNEYGITIESSLGEGTKMILHLKRTIDPDKMGITEERNEQKDV